ncbi:MAG: hypothetical protein R3C49_07015 [Planctomycetaceae bacterium]
MSEHNPFATGDYATGGASFDDDPNQHPQLRELIRLLVETRPWVRLFGILTIIGAVFMMLGSVFMIGVGAAGRNAGPAETGLLGVLYLLFGLLYLYPGLCLNRYASAITEAEASRQLSSINAAVLQQKKFWRFVGIIAAIFLTIYAIILLIGLIGLVVGILGR